jgi:hypothetical protein
MLADAPVNAWTLLIDAILVVVALEALVLWRLQRHIPDQRARAATQLTLAAGACLMLAVRAALSGSTLGLLLAMAAALLCHGGYLFMTVPGRR